MKNFSREEFIEDWKDWGIKNGIYEMYSAKLSTEAEKRWSHTASQWKNINETQKEINFKATGIRETNLERKNVKSYNEKEKFAKDLKQLLMNLKNLLGHHVLYVKQKGTKKGTVFART